MLLPLLYLLSLSPLTAADSHVRFVGPSIVPLDNCPITYYGESYDMIYVNYTDVVMICFNNYYSLEARSDCISGGPYDNAYLDLTITSGEAGADDLYETLTNITGPSRCSVNLVVADNSLYTFYDFGSQAALKFTSNASLSSSFVLLSFKVNGWRFQKKRLTDDDLSDVHYFDLSGCRHKRRGYEPGRVVDSPESCFYLDCNDTAHKVVRECGPMERCHGNNTCMFDQVCTVTGPSVVSFSERVKYVRQHCVFEVMSFPSEPEFQVVAKFRDRRRRDVSLLDSVTVQLNDSMLHLGPNGRILYNDTVLRIDPDVVQEVMPGVEITRTPNDIMVTVILTNYTVYVVFDGNKAHIRVTGPPGTVPSLMGLCGTSTVTESKIRNYDDTLNCNRRFTDPEDPAVNCKAMTKHCNLLMEAPFSECQEIVNPQPYIKACTNMLCKYPAVDGYKCHFLEGYARVCSMYGNSSLGNWRMMTKCSSSGGFCQDRVCTHNEFCAETEDGDPACFCRAVFAAPLRSSNMFGQLKACKDNTASVSLVGCLLEEKGINYADLRLNNETCRGRMNPRSHRVTFSFNSENTCGAIVMNNGSHVIYENTIKMKNSSDDLITRQDQVFVKFSCVHAQQVMKIMSLRIRENSVVQHIKSGVWNYDLFMMVYTDSERTDAVDLNTEVLLDQRLWVELKTEGLDGKLVSVVTDSCWATREESVFATTRYELVENGCANPHDGTVMVEGNGKGTSNYFSFKMFQFFGNSGDVYLHCRVELCIKENNNCVPTCNGGDRRRRSVDLDYEEEAVAFISMTWTN